MIHRDYANALLESIFGRGAYAVLDETGLPILDETGQEIWSEYSYTALTFETFYIAILVTEPAFEHTGTDLIEPSAATYERLQVTNNDVSFSAAVNASMTNNVDITFPELTEDWGTIRGWAICDAATNGLLLYSERTSQKFLRTGQTLRIPSGTMTLGFSNA